MGKATQLRLIGGKEPRQFMWETVREHREGFTPRLIAEASKQSLVSVLAYVRAMSRAKIIEQVTDSGNVPDHRWRLLQDEGAEHPRLNPKGQRSKHGQVLESLWRTLRIMGEVTSAQAAEMASVGGLRVTQSYAANYFGLLVRAGYLVKTDHSSQMAFTYKFAPGACTGPRHPVVQRDERIQVFDQNEGRVRFSTESTGGVPSASEPDNDMQQQNLRMKSLLADLLAGGATKDLIQRVVLELAE